MQDLAYTYDPIGNITHVEDAAHKTVFHNNEQVDAVASYTYDALYRLVEAHGREQIGQTAISLSPADGTSASSQIARSVDPAGSPSFMTVVPCLATSRTVGFSTASDIASNATKKSGVERMAATASGALGAFRRRFKAAPPR